jgi:hypothetical protein
MARCAGRQAHPAAAAAVAASHCACVLLLLLLSKVALVSGTAHHSKPAGVLVLGPLPAPPVPNPSYLHRSLCHVGTFL